VFIDLDGFKHINDTLGHEAGDRVLAIIGKRLLGAARKADIVGRFGGDEFVVVVTGAKCEDDVLIVANKIRDVVSQPMRGNEDTLTVTSSLGIAMFPDDGFDSQALLRNADKALYHAKAAGRNEIRFYNSEVSRESKLGSGLGLEEADGQGADRMVRTSPVSAQARLLHAKTPVARDVADGGASKGSPLHGPNKQA